MKNIFFLILGCILLFVSACTKEVVNPTNPNAQTGLIGTWDLIAGYGGDGANFAWHDVTASNSHYIRFIDSTKVETNEPLTPNCIGNCTLSTDSTIRTTYQCNPDFSSTVKITELKNNILILDAVGTDESVRYKYKKR
jgi:hypothetical protein